MLFAEHSTCYVIKTDLRGLAYFKEGQKCFEETIGKTTPLNGRILIELPENVVAISSSFAEGFFAQWVKRYGRSYVYDRVSIFGNPSPSRVMKESIWLH